MYSSQGFRKLLIIGLLVSGLAILSSVQADQSSDSLVAAVKVYNDIVKSLKDGEQGFYIGEDISEIAKQLKNQNLEMGQTQRNAIDILITINQDSHSAMNSAKDVVENMKSTCKNVKKELTQKNRDSLTKAIAKFVSTAKGLENKVRDAIAKSIDVQADSVLVKGKLTQLRSWISNKKVVMVAKAEAEKAEARAKGYGVAAAICFIPLVNLIGCPISMGVAVGVTEGVSVKEIEEDFDNGIKRVDRMLTSIDAMGRTMNLLVQRVRSDNTRMVNLHKLLDESQLQASVISSIESTFNIFFDLFKSSISQLYDSCNSYLR